MKRSRKSPPPKAAATPSATAAAARTPLWYWLAGTAAALLVLLQVYRPAIGGPFLLDDYYLPFLSPSVEQFHLRQWLNYGRPFLMLSFWLNYQAWGPDPAPFHVVNVLLHFAASAMVWLILRKALEWTGEQGWRREMWAACGGAIFLLHPLQTEAVAYIASRSDGLSVALAYAAFALFVYSRPEGAGWPRVAAILLLLGAAVMTKEHAAVFPALLLLADLFFGQGGAKETLRRNWRIYAPMLLLGLVAAAMIRKVLFSASTAGFGLREFTWYQYFFTQCRALWHYLRLYVLPFGQNLDPDFPISRGVTDHGAIIGLAALFVSLALAWYFRKRYPLSVYGWLAFLLLMSPTSSVVPILDPVAERRVYLAMIGLLMITVDWLRRWQSSRNAGVAFCVLLCMALGALSYQRNHLYSSSIAMWSDTAERSPKKVRPRFQLAYAYYQEGRCQEAALHYNKAAALDTPDARLLLNWALALDCAGRPDEALERLSGAARLENSAHIHATAGMIHGKQGRYAEAMLALDRAAEADPRFAMTYVYRGNVYASTGDTEKAIAEYQRALRLEPANQAARQALAAVGQGR